MMLSKHPLAGAALLVWVTTAAATPLLQPPAQALAMGQDLLVTQLAGTPVPLDFLAESMGWPEVRTAQPASTTPNSASSPAAVPSTVNTGDPINPLNASDNTRRPDPPAPASSGAGPLPGSISADAWAQIAALATACCAVLGLVLLKRSEARNTPSASPADQATQGKTGSKRRRVAYRL